MPIPISAYLFVYGTLRKGLNHPMHLTLARNAEFAGIGTFRGRLYNLGQFPAAIASERPSDQVLGEIYALRDAEWLFSVLDEYEGSKFRRETVPIILKNGKRLRCWIYLYTGRRAGLKIIGTGDYVEFRRSKVSSEDAR